MNIHPAIIPYLRERPRRLEDYADLGPGYASLSQSMPLNNKQCITFTDLVSDEVGFSRTEEHHLHERAPRLLDLNFQLQ